MAKTPDNPQQGQPQGKGLQHPVLDGVAAVALAKLGADTGALAGKASPPVLMALSDAKIAKLTGEFIRNMRRWTVGRIPEQREQVISTLKRLYPERPKTLIDELAAKEIEYEREFLRKMEQRLADKLPKALAEKDPVKRREAVEKVLRFEQRMVKAREQAMHDRAIAAMERMTVKAASPKGAYWRLSRTVQTHTPDCVALGDKWWPWEVIEAVGGPPRHHGCECALYTLDEAMEQGWMSEADANVDPADAMARARAALKKAGELLKECSLEEFRLELELLAAYDPDGDWILEGADVGGGMIALYPDPATARALALEGGEPASRLHVTLKFLGADHTEISSTLKDAIRGALRDFAAGQEPLEGHVVDSAAFPENPNHKKGERAVYAKVDVPGLREFRRALVEALPAGVMADTFPDFKPHMTLTYIPTDQAATLPDVPMTPVRFDEVYLVLGGHKEAFPLGTIDEAAFNPSKHLRNRKGEFIDMLGKAKATVAAAGVDPARAFAPGDASPANGKRMEYRMRAAAEILAKGVEIPDAVLHLPNDSGSRTALVKKLTSGDLGRAMKEYEHTPLADLEVLTHIHVADHPVYGQANTSPDRKLTMGSTSAIGDFRHELGHALRFAFGGQGGPSTHTPLTTYVAQRHDEALAKVKHNIANHVPKPKSEPEWEEKIGVADPRALDSWEEDFAEHYRIYHKAVYRSTVPGAEGADPDALKKYRQLHPAWARLWDAWYTAQLAGRLGDHDLTEARWDKRIPKAHVGGGRFMPRHGGVLKALLHELVPEMPRPPARTGGRGRVVKLHGHHVFIPERREFERTFAGRRYHSPRGSSLLYRDGEPYEVTGRELPAPLDVPWGQGTLNPAGALEQDIPKRIRQRVAGAADMKREIPPVAVNEPGWETDAALRGGGYILSAWDDLPEGMKFHYVGPDGVSRLEVQYDLKSRVASFNWEPSKPPALSPELERAPRSWKEFTDDLASYTRRIAAEHGHGAFIRDVKVNGDWADHSAEHQWDGDIDLGVDFPGTIAAAAIKRAMKKPLTDREKRDVYLAVESSHHEALHAANPMSMDDYRGPDALLEEALTEELAHVEASAVLRKQGQLDVCQWAVDHPQDPARIGTYPAARAALDALLNEAHVRADERERVIRELKLDTHPLDRPAAIAELIRRVDDSRSLEDTETHVREFMWEKGRPDWDAIVSGIGQMQDGFQPILTVQGIPSPAIEVTAANGVKAHVGDKITFTEQGEPLHGTITDLRIHDGDVWTADVTDSFGNVHVVTASTVEAVDGHDDTIHAGSTAPDLRLNGEVIRQGDLIHHGWGNDRRTATIQRILDHDPDHWLIHARTPEGHDILLTPDRGDLPTTARAVPPEGGPTEQVKPRTLGLMARVRKLWDAPGDAVLIPHGKLVPTAAARPERLRDIASRMADPARGARMNPVLVRPREDGRFDVLAGNSELHVARRLGGGLVPAVVTGQLTRQEQLEELDSLLERRRELVAGLPPGRGRQEHEAMVHGLERAREIIRRGEGPHGILRLAGEKGPLRDSGDSRHDAFQDGLRAAYLSLQDAERRNALRAYEMKNPSDAWLPKKKSVEPVLEDLDLAKLKRGVAVHVQMPSGQVFELRKEDAGGGKEMLRVRAPGGSWEKASLKDTAGLKVLKTGGQIPLGFGSEPAKFEPAPFDAEKLGWDTVRVKMPDGDEYAVRRALAKDAQNGTIVEVRPVAKPGQTPEAWALTPTDQLEGGMVVGKIGWSSAPPPPPKPVWDDSGQVQLTEYAGGSNGARFGTAKDGTKWFVKPYNGDVDRVATELLANEIYRKLGVKVPEAGTLMFGGKPAVAYPLVEGKPGGSKSGIRIDSPNVPLARGFMADAYLANWDVIGLEHDNVLWPEDLEAYDPTVEPTRLDQGGTLQFRAQGQKKPFGPEPSEVWTMARPGQGQAYGTMALTPAVKKAGARRIAETLKDSTIDELVGAAPFKDEKMREEVREALKARRDWMADYAKGKVAEPQPLQGSGARLALDAAAQSLGELRPEEHLAVSAWSEGWDAVVNDHLRTGAPKEVAAKEVKFLTKEMDSLSRYPKLKDDIRVYATLPAHERPAEGWESLAGRTVTDKGFLAAALEPAGPLEAADGGGALMRVDVPAGAAAFAPASLEKDYKGPDVIFPRGARLAVQHVAVEDGVPVVHVILTR